MIGKCKKCGGEDLSAYDTVIALAGISGWTRQADGSMEPEYDGGSEVLWDSQSPYKAEKPYHCGDCGELIALEDIEFTSGEEDEDNEPDDERPDYENPGSRWHDQQPQHG